MKKLLFLFLLVVFYFIIVDITFATPNPAAVYCKELGYEYKIVDTDQGQKGVCIFPDKECEEWDFFTGGCGKEYSYCVKKGYDIETATDGKTHFRLIMQFVFPR